MFYVERPWLFPKQGMRKAWLLRNLLAGSILLQNIYWVFSNVVLPNGEPDVTFITVHGDGKSVPIFGGLSIWTHLTVCRFSSPLAILSEIVDIKYHFTCGKSQIFSKYCKIQIYCFHNCRSITFYKLHNRLHLRQRDCFRKKVKVGVGITGWGWMRELRHIHQYFLKCNNLFVQFLLYMTYTRCFSEVLLVCFFICQPILSTLSNSSSSKKKKIPAVLRYFYSYLNWLVGWCFFKLVTLLITG